MGRCLHIFGREENKEEGGRDYLNNLEKYLGKREQGEERRNWRAI